MEELVESLVELMILTDGTNISISIGISNIFICTIILFAAEECTNVLLQ